MIRRTRWKASRRSTGRWNVMLDLANAMKFNPLLKCNQRRVFDLLTPYFQGIYEMRHLPIPPELRGNIEYRCYRSGTWFI